MQRLYTTFPDGRAGLGLLTLRVGLAAALLSFTLHQIDSLFHSWQRGAALLAAVLLLLGLFTPAVALVCAAGLSMLLVSVVPSPRPLLVLLILLFTATGLLGAGAYSLDARLYGRRRLISRPRGR